MKTPSEYSFNLLSVTGAAVAGFGLGALLHSFIGGAGAVIADVGLFAHGIRMLGRAKVGGKTASTWQGLLYWLCWLSLLTTAAYLLFYSLG